jgi:hypothetical protein
MAKASLTVKQKKADVDLLVIIIATMLVLGIFIIFQNSIMRLSEDKSINVILRTLVMAFFQFGVAGLGITIVSIFRKESFLSYGLKMEGILKTIFLSVLVFIPSIIFYSATGEATRYLPFQSVGVTKEVLASSFPTKIIGMSLIAIAWGFFEGFNYVVINEKLNARYPSKRKWLNWGAIICTIMCLLIHGMIGVTAANIIEAITVFIIIYGMLMIKEHTGNAWGCVFIFVFLWNAF